jgi:hypothetical protein
MDGASRADDEHEDESDYPHEEAAAVNRGVLWQNQVHR